jgi:hypothetical protein
MMKTTSSSLDRRCLQQGQCCACGAGGGPLHSLGTIQMKHLLICLLVSVQLECIAADGAASLGLLQDGEALLALGQFTKALDTCRSGLKVLGGDYSSPDLIDDTDLKLLAATLQEKDGKLDNAALVTCRILRERYGQWQSKNPTGKMPNHSFNTDALTRAG